MSEAPVPVVVARQPGTAAAFVPVVRHLSARGACPLVFGYPVACPVFVREGVACHGVDSFDESVPVLAGAGPVSWFLTGTSLDVDDDARWWAHARRVGAASVGFVDQWVNYWQRFALGEALHPRFDVAPDSIAVIDDVARARLVGFGARAEQVVVTGTPVLDLLEPAVTEACTAMRARMGAREGEKIVLFASEPESPVEGRGRPSPTGALALLLDTLSDLDQPALVVVRPHPRQRYSGAEQPLSGARGRVRFVVDGDHRPALLHAFDVVVGLQSMLLYEAGQAGRPAVSIRLGEPRPHDLADHPGIESVCVAEEAATVLHRALQAGPREVSPAVGKATALFLDRLGIET